MRHLFTAFLILAGAFAALGQYDYRYSNLGNYADQLKKATSTLADRSSQDVLRGYSNGRNEIENAFLAMQTDGAATLFLDMTRQRRPINELRDAGNVLAELSRRAPAVSSQAAYWRIVQAGINNVTRELGLQPGGGGFGGNTGAMGGYPPPPPPIGERPIIGRVEWRGMVDDRVQLVIRGGFAETRTISGTALGSGNYNFGSALPNRNVDIQIEKKKGRGQVRLIQQPSRSNNYTAIVEIYDEGSGAREYDVDIYWR